MGQDIINATYDRCPVAYIFQVEDDYIDFGTVVIGSTAMKPVILINDSDCNLQYSLIVTQTVTGPYPEDDNDYEPQGNTGNTILGSLA